MMNRFRCVICWSLAPWSKGCADELELAVTAAIDQHTWTDRIAHRPVSDGGVCDDCWAAVDAMCAGNAPCVVPDADDYLGREES